MTSLVLLGWAAVVVALARPALTSARLASLPRLTIGLWLGAELSITVAVLTAGLLAAVPPAALSAGLAGIIAACAQALASIGAPNGTLAVIALLATTVLAARLATSLITTFAGARRWRRRHLAALLPLAAPDAGDGWTLVEHATPVVYCLPGRPGQVVVTSAARDALTADEFAAVLRHERAHLRGRHHVLVALAVAFHRALPGLGMAGTAEAEIRRLVEHLADDRASERHGRHAVATAIVQLADRTPQHALGAGTGAVDRVRRMLAPPARPRVLHRLVAAGAIGLLLAGPPTVAVASAGLTVHGETCSSSPSSADEPGRTGAAAGSGLGQP
ncbi:M56 family metallopeptidase [Micromonospora halophytica]|uniref:Peptidase family M48 n=1 Tax=Micromonospora halophytica TaxID=47864 RepID=A0A1C5JJU0_9ACTN|nr:M56 family metallopeptidase [Micromonospora halophytica]SCG70306.1 Peptidase family M48 [Micromonospora halophytica]